ncbi:MAG: RteC domain-containing protein [Chryseolinea sp.]
MDIITFSKQLQDRINSLNATTGLDANIFRDGQTLHSIRLILEELKEFTVSYTFSDETEEIRFFKEVKPALLSPYIYYRCLYKMTFFNSFRDPKLQNKQYQRLLKKLSHFAHKHQSFHEYYVSGSTYLDNQYFRRGPHTATDLHDERNFTTRYDRILSQLQANEMIKEYVIKAISQQHEELAYTRFPGMNWTHSKVALVELVYSLHASKVFNDGRVDVRQIAKFFEQSFGIDLANHARIFSDIKLRKGGYSTFLDQLKENLNKVASERL